LSFSRVISFVLFRKCRLHGKSALGSIDLQSLAGVSVLKPLTGVDPNLYANLETFFNMKYPKVCSTVCMISLSLVCLMCVEPHSPFVEMSQDSTCGPELV